MLSTVAINIFNLLKEKTLPKVVITTHHKPDADAMGSSMGLHHFLKQIGIDSKVISPTDFANNLKWMPNSENVINFEESTDLCKAITDEADFIFCLDFNDLKRINEYGEVVSATKSIKILIDHHQHPIGFEDYSYWDDKASSTCELVYRFIHDIGLSDLINKSIASCLYTGILMDTGSFKYSNCSGQTHRIVAELIDAGANHIEIGDAVFDSFSEDRVRFIGYAISQKMEVFKDLNTALIVINDQELLKYNVTTGDTEGLVNYGLSIEGVKFAVLIIDRTKLVKMSFRSKGNFAANNFAKENFNGGGHFHAAGGSSDLSLEDTVKKFKTILYNYKEDLNV
ncbi:MAG: DHH family phosphoesterase [Bacteroidota bacterium]|nr:DHH family phosphoesterase [Bacteroidota bacterium]